VAYGVQLSPPSPKGFRGYPVGGQVEGPVGTGEGGKGGQKRPVWPLATPRHSASPAVVANRWQPVGSICQHTTHATATTCVECWQRWQLSPNIDIYSPPSPMMSPISAASQMCIYHFLPSAIITLYLSISIPDNVIIIRDLRRKILMANVLANVLANPPKFANKWPFPKNLRDFVCQQPFPHIPLASALAFC